MPKFILILLVVSFFTSCYSPRYVYSPATQNIPLLSKKNDFVAAANFAVNTGGSGARDLGNSSEGFDIHTAFGVTNHFAVMLNQYKRWEHNTNGNDYFSGDSLNIKYTRSLTEIAAGYFTSLKNNNSYFQFFTGAAFGNFSINEHSDQAGSNLTRFHKSAITKIFIQPSITSGQQKNFTASFSLRFTGVFYHDIQTDYSTGELDDYFLSGLSNSPVFFAEPAMNFVFGFKKIKPVKFQIQTGIAILLNRRFIDYRTANFGLGVVSNFLNHHTAKISKN